MKKSENNAVDTSAKQTTPALKPYQYADQETAEILPKYLYLAGRPKQYRYDSKEGIFNLNGTDKLGITFSFQPISWRFFEDDILQLGKKKWCELFFIDDKNCVSVIMFHGYSVENLLKMSEPLFYEKLTLKDVIITAIAERKENTKTTPKSVYYLADFSYQIAEPEKVKELEEYAKDFPIYRMDTVTPNMELIAYHGYHIPQLAEIEAQKQVQE